MRLTGLTFDDVLLRPQRGVLNSRSEADVSVPELGLAIPLISAPMPSVASIPLLNEINRLGGLGVINRMGVDPATVKNFISNSRSSAVAIGLETEIDWMVEWGVTKMVLDIAHAHSEKALNKIDEIKYKYGNKVFLIAGNVATQEGAQDLASAGADAIKVGIGPGSACTTRQVTGFGVPQLEAIEAAATYLDKPVIADGGIRNSGDIVKALAAGASAVMIGNLFARSVEAANGGVYYGAASHIVNGHHAPEGITLTLMVDNSNTIEGIVKNLIWGLKSGISYAGARNIEELQRNAEWIRLTDAGRRESKYA